MKTIFTLIFLLFFFPIFSQTILEVDPKDLYAAGDTRSLGNNCFRLTTAQYWEGGSVWYDPKISLLEPFEMEMNILFGCKDEMGADGLVFIFHTQKIPLGYKGEGMGFAGMIPSLGVEIDTYQNFHLMDPAEDHVGIMAHGTIRHYDDFNLVGPVKLPNIEDCQEHLFRINWEPDAKRLSVYLDNQKIVAHSIDLVGEIFNGETDLYWGVAAATGKKTNMHEICFEQLTFNEPQLGYSTKRDLLEGTIVDLPNIDFPTRSERLPKEAIEELDKMVLFLKDNPKHSIQLYLHSNEGGNSDTEKTKSQRRSVQILKYLQQKGISNDRISMQAMGSQYAKQKVNESEIFRQGNWVNAYMFIPRA